MIQIERCQDKEKGKEKDKDKSNNKEVWDMGNQLIKPLNPISE